jgi:sortase A
MLLGAGVLILLFVAYQLWGTTLVESHDQAVLRQRFDALLHQSAHSTTTIATPTTSAPTSTSAGENPTVGPPVAAPSQGDPIGILRIDKIGVDKVVVEGTSTADLRQGPGHYVGTPLPGEPGNAAIAAHRTTYGAPFYNLDKLGPGDSISVTTVQGTFDYRVTRTVVVSPNDVSVVAATTTPELTLTTCNPRFSDSQRLVVHALLTSTPAPAATPVPRHGSTATASADAVGLGGEQGGWVPALVLGVVAAAVIATVMIVGRSRRRRPHRWAVYVVGTAASLVALFFFFGAVSPLLPASF